jgi:hypothetical protein
LAAEVLDEPEQPLVGVLSDPGRYQRLVVISNLERVVVKVAVGAGADAIVERERACLLRLQETAWRALGPRALSRSPSVGGASRSVLVMEQVAGTHPRWDDEVVHADLLRALTGGDPSAPLGLHHGDVTPWNAFRTPEGSLVLVDWESADLDLETDPLCGVLDFVLRGAVVARARRSRVQRVVRAVSKRAGGRLGKDPELVATYRDYRAHVGETLAGRPDTLGRSADRLLGACLSDRAGR